MSEQQEVATIEAHVLWTVGFWDGALSGVCLVEDRLCWFETDTDPLVDDERIYAVYDLTDEEVRVLVTSHFMFETYVGGHTCTHPIERGVRAREHHSKFYDRNLEYPDFTAGKQALGTLTEARVNDSTTEDTP